MESLVSVIVALVTLAGALISGLKIGLSWIARQLEIRDKYQREQLDAAVGERKTLTDRFLQSLDERAAHDRQADELVSTRLEEVARLIADSSGRSTIEHKALMDILARRRESDMDQDRAARYHEPNPG